jgi:metallo-beta-lactamase family protein
MAESGRVLHHLKNNIDDSKNTVLIVGYQAAETLGRRLVEAKDKQDVYIKIFGEEHQVRAKIYVLNSFSAHADRDELIQYFSRFDKTQLEQIYLVHGDLDQQQALGSALAERNFKNVDIPEKGNEVII